MKVFFANDGSPDSLAAVRQVGQLLSEKTDAAALYFAPPEVLVLQSTMAKALQERAVKVIADGIFAEARRLLPGMLAKTVKTILADVPPRQGILLDASRWGADLIVVGARGMSAIERVLLGSVSRTIAHHSKLPVYVARPSRKHGTDEPFRVLFAYDGSPSSEQALFSAQGLTLPAKAEVIATTVVDVVSSELPQWVAHGRPGAEWDPIIRHWIDEAEADKRQLHEKLSELMKRQKAPFEQAEVVVTEGEAADRLLTLIDSRKIDLVVTGSGGKAAWERFLLGSTSEKLLNNASCSVLIAHERRFVETADG